MGPLDERRRIHSSAQGAASSADESTDGRTRPVAQDALTAFSVVGRVVAGQATGTLRGRASPTLGERIRRGATVVERFFRSDRYATNPVQWLIDERVVGSSTHLHSILSDSPITQTRLNKIAQACRNMKYQGQFRNPHLRDALFLDMQRYVPYRVADLADKLAEVSQGRFTEVELSTLRGSIFETGDSGAFNPELFERLLKLCPRPRAGESGREWIAKLGTVACISHPQDPDQLLRARMDCPNSVNSLPHGALRYSHLVKLFSPDQRAQFDSLIDIRGQELLEGQFSQLYQALEKAPADRRIQSLNNLLIIDPECTAPLAAIDKVDGERGIKSNLLPTNHRGTVEQRAEIALWSIGKTFLAQVVRNANLLSDTVGIEHYTSCVEFYDRHPTCREFPATWQERLQQIDDQATEEWSFTDKLELVYNATDEASMTELINLVNAHPGHDRKLIMQLAKPFAPHEMAAHLERLLEHSDTNFVAELLDRSDNPREAALRILENMEMDPFEAITGVPRNERVLMFMGEQNISLQDALLFEGLPERIHSFAAVVFNSITRSHEVLVLLHSLDEAVQEQLLRFFQRHQGEEAERFLDIMRARGLSSEEVPGALRLYDAQLRAGAEGSILLDRSQPYLPQLSGFLQGPPDLPLKVEFLGEWGVDEGGLRRDALQRGSDEIPEYFQDTLVEMGNQMEWKGGANPAKARELGNLLGLMSEDSVPLPERFAFSPALVEEAARFTPDQLKAQNLEELVRSGNVRDLYQQLFPERAEHMNDYPEEDLQDQIMDREMSFQFAKGLSADGVLEISPNFLDSLKPPENLRQLILDNLTTTGTLPARSLTLLTNWIKNASEEKLKKFMRIISGVNTLPRDKKIIVTRAPNVNFYAHSCSLQLDLGDVGQAVSEEEWNTGFEAMLDDPQYTAA